MYIIDKSLAVAESSIRIDFLKSKVVFGVLVCVTRVAPAQLPIQLLPLRARMLSQFWACSVSMMTTADSIFAL